MSYTITYYNPIDEEIQKDQRPHPAELRAGSSKDVMNLLNQHREKPSYLNRKTKNDEKGRT
jgi:hypothetical protein